MTKDATRVPFDYLEKIIEAITVEASITKFTHSNILQLLLWDHFYSASMAAIISNILLEAK